MVDSKKSRYGRLRKMSAKANEATSDTCMLFFMKNRSTFQPCVIYLFMTRRFIDPVDLWRYLD